MAYALLFSPYFSVASLRIRRQKRQHHRYFCPLARHSNHMELAVGIEQGLLSWANYHLSALALHAENMGVDMEDGYFLMKLIEGFATKQPSGFHSRLAQNEPIADETKVKENQESILQWAAEYNSQLTSKVIPGGKYTPKAVLSLLTRVSIMKSNFDEKGPFEAALRSLLSSVSQYLPNLDSELADLICLAVGFKDLHLWDLSAAYLKKSLDSAQTDEKHGEIVPYIRFQLGLVYQLDDRLDEALVEYHQAVSIFEKSGETDTFRIAVLRESIGDVYLAQKKSTEALSEYNKALELRSKIDGEGSILAASTTQKLGDALLDARKFEEAKENFEKAKVLLEKASGAEPCHSIRVVLQIAQVHLRQNNLSESLSLVKESHAALIALLESHSTKQLAETLETVGNLYHELKEYNESLSVYQKTLEMRKAINGPNHPDYATALENIGRTNFQLGSYEGLEEYFKDAAKIRNKSKNPLHLKNTTQIEGLIGVFKSKNEHGLCVLLYKTQFIRLANWFGYESSCPWNACKSADSYFTQRNHLNEAIEFWEDIRDIYSKRLGWAHTRTLNSCEYIFNNSAALGSKKEPAEFTHVKSFIQHTIANAELDAEWNRHQIISNLFKIVLLSKDDEAYSKQSSDALTLLNFMNVPLNGTNLSKVKIPNANLSNSIISGIDFTEANLSGVNFTNSLIEKTNFKDANLDNIKLGIPQDTLKGHMNTIHSVCHATGPNNESWIVSGSGDNRIIFWDVATGNQDMVIEAHTGEVTALIEIRNAEEKSFIVSGSKDKTIRIWDNITREEKKSIETSSEVISICGLCGPNKESWVASVNEDNKVYVWDVETGAQVKDIPLKIAYPHVILHINGPNGEDWLALAGGFGSIELLDISTASHVRLLEGHSGDVRGLCIIEGDNGEKWLGSSGKDGIIRIWDLATGFFVKSITDHNDAVTSILFVRGSNGERWLVSGSSDTSVRVWDLRTLTQLYMYPVYTGTITSLCCAKGPNDEILIAAGCRDHSIRLFDLHPDTQIKGFSVNKEIIVSVCSIQGPNGEPWLASGSTDSTINIWDMTTGYLVRKLEGHTETIYTIIRIQGPNGENWIASGGRDNTVFVWDVATGQQIKSLKSHESSVRSLVSAYGPNDEKWIVSGGSDSYMIVWDLASGQEVKRLTGEDCAGACFVQGPNKEAWFISGNNYGKVTVWNLTDGSIINSASGHNCAIYGVCAVQGQNGELWFASGSDGDENNLIVWDLKTLEKVAMLSGHSIGVYCVSSFTGQNGETLLASGGRDRTVRIWDVTNQRQIAVFEGHKEHVWNVCSSKSLNGDITLVSGGCDKTIRIWDVETGDRITTLDSQSETIQKVSNVKGQNGESLMISMSFYNTLAIWDVQSGTKLQQLTPSDVVLSEGQTVVKKDSGELMALFNSPEDAYHFFEDIKVIPSPKRILGQRKLEGDEIQLDNSSHLSAFNKARLLSIGATSIDSDFIKYCQSGSYTKRQATVMSQCYENGWVVNKDTEQATYWRDVIPLKMSKDFGGLKKVVQEGSKHAFEVLKEFASAKEDVLGSFGKKSGEKFKYPHVVSIVAECYENGWGVEKDMDMSAEYYGKADDFSNLRRLVGMGSEKAFKIMLDLSSVVDDILQNGGWGSKIGESFRYPDAVFIIAQSYENGWSINKDIKEACRWYGKAKKFDELKRLLVAGSMETFEVLKELSEVKEDVFHYDTKVGEKIKYPETFSLIAACYENGWTVELNLKEAVEWCQKVNDFTGLKNIASKGSEDAFAILKAMSETKLDILKYGDWGDKVGERYEHPEAAASLTECYEHGWGTEKDVKMAAEWYGKLEKFDYLLEMAKKGIKEASDALINLANEKVDVLSYGSWGDKVGERYKYTDAVKLLAQCLENGWGAETDLKRAVEYYGALQSFDDLNRLSQSGSKDAFDALFELGTSGDDILDANGVKTGVNYKNPQALPLIAECLENGWGVDKDLDKASDFYRNSENFEKLKELAQQGLTKAFGLLKEASEVKEDVLDYYGNKTGERLKYRQVLSMLGECYENGWGTEKDSTKVCEIYGKDENFSALETLAKDGSTHAFNVLKEFSQKKGTTFDSYNGGETGEGFPFSHVIEIVANCYENGWGTEKDSEQLNFWRNILPLRAAYDYDGLKKLAQEGSSTAFAMLQEISDVKEDIMNYRTKIGQKYKYPLAISALAECFEHGWGTAVDKDAAVQLLTKAENWEKLKTMAKDGVCSAFTNLLAAAEKKDDILNYNGVKTGEQRKYPEAVAIVTECYENGWGVEKDIKQAFQWHSLAEHFDLLKQFAQQGSQDAFEALCKIAEVKEDIISSKGPKIGEKIKYAQAVAYLVECYENGWGTEKNTRKAIEWHGLLENFSHLQELVQAGSQDAFDVLKNLAELKVNSFNSYYGSKTGTSYKYSQAAPIVAECYENGWAVEKDEDKAHFWKVLVPLREAADFSGLKEYAEKGSHDAFELIVELAEMKQDTLSGEEIIGEEYMYPQAHLVLSECYENGWGVEKNAEKAVEWKEKGQQ